MLRLCGNSTLCLYTKGYMLSKCEASCCIAKLLIASLALNNLATPRLCWCKWTSPIVDGAAPCQHCPAVTSGFIVTFFRRIYGRLHARPHPRVLCSKWKSYRQLISKCITLLNKNYKKNLVTMQLTTFVYFRACFSSGVGCDLRNQQP